MPTAQRSNLRVKIASSLVHPLLDSGSQDEAEELAYRVISQDATFYMQAKIWRGPSGFLGYREQLHATWEDGFRLEVNDTVVEGLRGVRVTWTLFGKRKTSSQGDVSPVQDKRGSARIILSVKGMTIFNFQDFKVVGGMNSYAADEFVEQVSASVLKISSDQDSLHSKTRKDDFFSSSGKGIIGLESTPAKSWEIKLQDLQVLKKIGSGAYGEVLRAKWKGTDVVVKCLFNYGRQLGSRHTFKLSGEKTTVHGHIGDKESLGSHLETQSVGGLTELVREINILASLRHPNIVLFLGACQASPDFFLVTEFCPRGSLEHVLYSNGAVHKLDLRLRIHMALDIAKGMNFLHSARPPIIHRDLKPANLLIGMHYEVKVADFGLSYALEGSKKMVTAAAHNIVGTPNYTAPEVLQGRPYTEKADIWSFGVVLWELILGKRPWEEYKSAVQVITAVAVHGKTLEPVPLEICFDIRLGNLIQQCAAHDDVSRPSFSNIICTLQEIFNDLQNVILPHVS